MIHSAASATHKSEQLKYRISRKKSRTFSLAHHFNSFPTDLKSNKHFYRSFSNQSHSQFPRQRRRHSLPMEPSQVSSPGYFDWERIFMEDPEASLPSTETIPLAADDQQPPPLPPQIDDVAPTLELVITDNPELTASDIVMLALEPRLRAADQAFLKMVFYAWRASRTLQGISLQWSRNIKNHTLLSAIFDAWQAGQQPVPVVLPPTTDLETHQISYPTPLTSNTSEDITQLHNDFANQRPLHAPLTDAEGERSQEETDSAHRGESPRNASTTEHLPQEAMPPLLNNSDATSDTRAPDRTVTFVHLPT